MSAERRLSVVLVIARYPPHHAGGYELRCRDVARELARRGHAVTVLTSRVGARGVEDDGGVRVVRQLHHHAQGIDGRAETLGFLFSTASDCRRLRRESKNADVVAYWHQQGLTSALLAVKPRRGCGILCDVSSDWLRELAGSGGNWFRIWEKPAGTAAKRAAKSVLRVLTGLLLRVPVRRPPFPPGRAYFTSEDNKRAYVAAGVDVLDAALIRSGIDLGLFRYVDARPAGVAQILFLGRIKRRKGLHTLVLALGDVPNARLRAVGPVEEEDYLAEVAELARAARVMDRMEFGAPVAHSEVASLLAGAHVLVFASEEPEAFSRLVLEAFAVGTPVIGTPIGGTGEVLREGDTGLTFAPGNSRELSNQLKRLLADEGLRARLVANARKLVESRYSLGFTVDQIEALLRQAVERARSATPK